MGLFDGIGSAIGSAFTPHGWNAAQDSQNAQGAAQGAASSYLDKLQGLFSSEAANASRMAPFQQRSMWNTAQSLANPSGLISGMRGQDMSAFAKALPMILNMLRSGGAGIGSQQGAGISAANNAIRQGNEFAGSMYSPQGMAARSSALSNLNTMPSLQALSQLASTIYGRPAVQMSGGAGSFLGPLMQLVASGGFGA